LVLGRLFIRPVPFFFLKKKGKAIQQLFQPLFCCCRRYSKGMLLLFLSKGGRDE
jgi:hypothetical protein